LTFDQILLSCGCIAWKPTRTCGSWPTGPPSGYPRSTSADLEAPPIWADFRHEGTVRRMMLTGKPLSAQDAQRVGLIDYLVGRSDWPRAVHRLGPMLALTTAAPFRGAKKLLNESAPQHKMLSTVYPRCCGRAVPRHPATGQRRLRSIEGPPRRARCFAGDRLTAGSGPETR
jgi:hypothetical protein